MMIAHARAPVGFPALVSQGDCALTRTKQGKTTVLVSRAEAGFTEGRADAAVAGNHFQNHQMIASFARDLHQLLAISRPEVTQIFPFCYN